MNKKIPPSSIAPKARLAARQLREIAMFLEKVDALDTPDIPGWEYMEDRFFTDERSMILDVADILEDELAAEAENYAKKTVY